MFVLFLFKFISPSTPQDAILQIPASRLHIFLRRSNVLDKHSCRNQSLNGIQGNMSEDEALARALALSMQDTGPNTKLTQEELDLALARQLQANENQTNVGATRSSNRDRCHIS